ncbi:hypothetical protein NDU88_008702 [Pleurodeles waltl]|uniref:Uncharacterized protein n=1 Tax=Pleurodeles waltl TaxID=8319 RepID=A0AAV7QSK1_PLEWA|nr:hypothetical protein NDU88_008702 [Pleurodeles waltl]
MAESASLPLWLQWGGRVAPRRCASVPEAAAWQPAAGLDLAPRALLVVYREGAAPAPRVSATCRHRPPHMP